MAEGAGPPPIDGPPHAADPGPPLHARLDGILEGRLGDASAVRAALARINAAGFGRFDLEVDGGRFSLLPDADFVPAARMTDDRRRGLFEALQAASAASSAPVESTLRCSEVFRDAVRETLFVADGAGLRALTRERPRTDAERAAAEEEPAPGRSGGARLLLAALLLVAFALVAWRSGWIDRALAPGADAIQVDAGAFEGLLDVAVESTWGDYRVTVRRGPRYPVTTEQVDALQRAAVTPADRAAAAAVATGGDVWVRLETSAGKGLAARNVALRPLVESAEREATVNVPGAAAGARVRLALDAGPEFR